jgi:hypothetical protein
MRVGHPTLQPIGCKYRVKHKPRNYLKDMQQLRQSSSSCANLQKFECDISTPPYKLWPVQGKCLANAQVLEVKFIWVILGLN